MRTRTIIRRTVWGLVICATLIALFYAEEDWRGARALRMAEEEYKNAGHSLDFAHFIPPPIPDDENLAALPIFALQPDPQFKKEFRPLDLEKALGRNAEQLPSVGPWQHGDTVDPAKFRSAAANIYVHAFPGKTPPPSALQQFEAVYPLINQLREASDQRFRCRFDREYSAPTPLDRPMAPLTDQIRLAQAIVTDAVLALSEKQSDLALDDLRVLFVLHSGMRRDPSLIGGLIAIGLGAMTESVIATGLQWHEWNDAQLAELQGLLSQMNYLSDYPFALQGELSGQLAEFQQIRHILEHEPAPIFISKRNVLFTTHLPWLAGWTDENLAKLIHFSLTNLTIIDPSTRRVYPSRERQLEAIHEESVFLGRYVMPWNLLYYESTDAETSVATKFARAQAWLEHSIIACALERYRLAHGSYPTTLSALEPEYIASLPNDFMTGEPYHYRVQPDGSYLLYSVGWNQKDDGGTLVYMDPPSIPRSIDYDQGDWVWFGPK
jgi:hypothetical protein